MAHIFDREAAMERVDNDAPLLCELVDICTNEFATKSIKLRTAAAEGQYKTVYELAHSLKGAFGNVGAMVVHEAALALEQAGKKGDAESVPGALDAFEAAAREFFVVFEGQRDSL